MSATLVPLDGGRRCEARVPGNGSTAPRRVLAGPGGEYPAHWKVGNMKILYAAEAVVEGGREGHGRTSDGRLEVDLSVPEDMGGKGGPGTNPEQLFAVGYGACFQSALLNVANGRKLDASD